MFGERMGKDDVSSGQALISETVVHIAGRQEAKAVMMMLVVVPGEEPSAEGASVLG